MNVIPENSRRRRDASQYQLYETRNAHLRHQRASGNNFLISLEAGSAVCDVEVSEISRM